MDCMLLRAEQPVGERRPTVLQNRRTLARTCACPRGSLLGSKVGFTAVLQESYHLQRHSCQPGSCPLCSRAPLTAKIVRSKCPGGMKATLAALQSWPPAIPSSQTASDEHLPWLPAYSSHQAISLFPLPLQNGAVRGAFKASFERKMSLGLMLQRRGFGPPFYTASRSGFPHLRGYR